MKRVLYLAENAISPIQGGGIVVYALLRGLPPENLFGFYCYENITPAPEYAERLHPLTMRDGGGAGSSNYFRPQLAQSHGVETISGKLLRGSRVFAAHLKDRLLHTDADLAMERIDAANYVPEVIFLAGLSFRMLHLARRLAERYSIPVVMLNMDDWMSDQTARSHPLSAYMRGAIAAEMRAIAPHVQVAISNSPHLAAELTRRYGIVHDTVNNACYDLMSGQGFVPRKKESEGPLVITFSGALNWHLQGETLVLFSYAIAELATRRPVELHIFTPWEFAPIANQISIPGKVIYKGFCSKDDLVKHYLASDFLVASTTFDELNILLFKHSLATKVSDYLCAGRPIISIGHPEWAVHDYVDKHSAGVTIRKGRIDEIKKSVARMLDWTPEQRELVGRSNRKLWEDAHDIVVMGRRAREAMDLGPVPAQL
jgi:hypothetical protein